MKLPAVLPPRIVCRYFGARFRPAGRGVNRAQAVKSRNERNMEMQIKIPWPMRVGQRDAEATDASHVRIPNGFHQTDCLSSCESRQYISPAGVWATGPFSSFPSASIWICLHTISDISPFARRSPLAAVSFHLGCLPLRPWDWELWAS